MCSVLFRFMLNMIPLIVSKQNLHPRGVLPEVSHPEFQNLGDIFIAPAYVAEQMKQPEFGGMCFPTTSNILLYLLHPIGIPVQERLPRLLTHGVCHLLG